MTMNDKSNLWQILTKYDNTLTSFAGSISKAIQSKETSEDLVNILKSYRKIDKNDAMLVDSILGDKITFSING